MNTPCPNRITCPGSAVLGAEADYPIANFSSEEPDQPIFIVPNWGWGNPDPPLGTIWSTPGCKAWCVSTVSQEDAELCAARQQLLCITDNPPDVPPGSDGTSDPKNPVIPGVPPPDPTKPQLYRNNEQRAEYTCPDGSKITETVPAGSVEASSQYQADLIAATLAQKNLLRKIICVPHLDLFACSDPLEDGPEYSFQVDIKVTSPIVLIIASGLPPGITMDNKGLISGFPTTPGDYNFTITISTSTNTKSVTGQFHVLGINGSRFLPNAPVDHPYTYDFTSGGGGIDYFLDDGALPNGMTLDNFGRLSGTPDTVGMYHFTVTVRDAFFNECSREFSLDVNGPKFTNANPPNGTECTSYAFTFTAVGSGAVTFSGTAPASMHIKSDGTLVNGSGGTPCYPTAKGSQTFHVIATDADGNTNYKDWTVTIAPSGDGEPKSLQDIGNWSKTIVATAPGASWDVTQVSSGDETVQLTLAGNNTFTTEANWKATLSRCAGVADYAIQWTLDYTYSDTGSNAVNFEVQLEICGFTPYNTYGVGGSTSNSVHASGTLSPPLVPAAPAGSPNMQIIVRNSTHPFASTTVFHMTITLRPLTPP